MYELVDKLNLRDSFKGGRTEVFRMYCCVEDPENERISYLDVNLLYPYVMSKTDFPLGHPEIRRGNNSCRNLLTVEKANKSDHLADYLDLTFIIDNGGKLSTRLYDKRDDFNFHIVNFPFFSSNIPSGPSYGVYISQLIRYARCCSHYDDFRYCHKCLVD